MPRETYLPDLLQLFQQYGYDGATLSKIAQGTGLGRASLYHYFPGGKLEMATAVFDDLENWLERNLLQELQQTGDPLTRLRRMCDQVNLFYAGGQQPCLFAILSTGSAHEVFHNRIKSLLQRWIHLIAAVLIEAGIEPEQADERAEDAITSIQGSLILVQLLDDLSPFQRMINQLPDWLCRDAD